VPEPIAWFNDEVVEKPDLVEVVTTGMSARGDAVGRDTLGRHAYVSGALPGERVRAQVLSASESRVRSRLVAVLEASPHRTTPPCPEFLRGCGGCQWQYATPDGQLRMKEAIVVEALARRAVAHPPLRPSIPLAPWAFRTTIRAAVVDGRLGFRQARSHDIVGVTQCEVAHPLLAELIEHGRYDGATEVTLKCGARTGERLAAAQPAHAEIDVPEDARRSFIHEEAAGHTWRISSDSFFQSRPDGADALAQAVLDAAHERGTPTKAVDLYAGVGLFAGVLATNGWGVTAVERARSSVADARVNLASLGVRVVRADVAKFRPPRCDFVVADPSREGLERTGVATVMRTHAARVVLVSCDVDAFTRDAALMQSNGYEMTSVQLVDLFPHTFHVEVVSIFDR